MRIRFICAAIAISIGVSSAYAGPTLFDWKYYGTNNPDVVAVYGNTKEAMLAHYTSYGWKEGRKGYEADTKPRRMKETAASQRIDWEYYRDNNPDVVAVFGNTKEAMLAHYKAYGFAEGRKRDQGDIPWKTRKQNDWVKHISTFDWEYYGANNPDVVAVYGNTEAALIAHYTAFGFAEGRSPNKENTDTDNSLLDTLYITKYDLDDEINNLSEVAIKVYIEFHKASRNGFQDKAEFEEAAKKKAAEEEDAAQKKQSSDPTIVTGRLNYTFVPLNNAKIKISNDNILTNGKFNTLQQNKKDQNELLSLKVLEINTVKLQPHNFEFGEMPIFDAYTANPMRDTQTDSKYFPENIDYEKQAADYAKLVKHNLALQANTLTNEHVQKTLKNETLAGDPLYGKRMVIEFLIKTDPNRMKVITNNGIIRTIYSSNAAKLNIKDGISKYQGLTMGSVLLNTNLTGRDQGTPLCIYNLVNAVTNIAYSGKSHFKNQDMRDLASRTYKYLINIIDDKNKDKAMEMPAYLLKQIQLQAGSIDNSGGSAGGHDHHHEEGHHEEPM